MTEILISHPRYPGYPRFKSFRVFDRRHCISAHGKVKFTFDLVPHFSPVDRALRRAMLILQLRRHYFGIERRSARSTSLLTK
jgi:hypothetical protein